jgi:hypothetical protein
MKRLLAAFLVACGATPPPAAPPALPATPTFAHLFHELPSSGRRFPLPLVRGTVGGQPTILIVDTGAQINVVTGWLARQAHISLSEPILIVDPAGNPVSMHRIDNVAITLDGLGAVPSGPVAVADLAPVFEKIGIGAIVSPQSFATAEHAVSVDLPRAKLSFVPAAATRGASSVQNARICTYSIEGTLPRILVGDGVVDGVPLAMEIDTGADELTIVADSDAGRKVTARGNGISEEALSAAGALPQKLYRGVPVSIGAATIADVTVTAARRHPDCGYDGRVSIAELEACEIVVGVDAARVSCTTPGAPSGPPAARP